MKDKLYIISGLGADYAVLEKLRFPSHIEVIFIPWLIPENEETFSHYIARMASKIDNSEPFYLLGYSFGGIVVQEIAKLIPPKKTIILGSIRSYREKSWIMQMDQYLKITRLLPTNFFNANSMRVYFFLRKIFDFSEEALQTYFRVKDSYYLHWCIRQISQWKGENLPGVIQILGDKDIVFPIHKCHPDYTIHQGTHLFPVTKHREVSRILEKILAKTASVETSV